MASIKAKTINLLLYDGDLSGVISIEDSLWNSGELYSAPRDSINELIESDACKKYGVYMLISQEMVYIGQASDLARRISQHLIGKDWWQSAVVLTTKDDSLTHSDIDYLEATLIEKAHKINHLDCDNKNKGNKPKVDKYRAVYLEQYLEEALFLMQLIGINVFNENTTAVKGKTALFNTLDIKTRLMVGKRVKADAMAFLKDNGVEVDKSCTYAVRTENKAEFAANPKKEFLLTDWDIVLNNNVDCELIVLKVPKNTFEVSKSNSAGLHIRGDKPQYLDIHIELNGFIERKSGLDFSKYVVWRGKY